MKEKIQRLVILTIGLIIAHLGVSMFLLTKLGSDPYNVMVQGLSDKLPITHGTTHIIISALIVVILLIVDRSYVKIGTLVCMLLGGPIIDLWNLVFGNLINETNPLWARIIVVVIACAILAFGMTIVITSEAGTGPNDLVALVISEKTKKKFGIVRVIVDFTFFAIGALLGGVFGIGTIICAFLVGIVAGFFMPFSKKLVSKALKLF